MCTSGSPRLAVRIASAVGLVMCGWDVLVGWICSAAIYLYFYGVMTTVCVTVCYC